MALTGTTTRDEQHRMDLLEALGEIATSLNGRDRTLPAPIVNVSVDPPAVTLSPSKVMVQERVVEMPTYLFTINRNTNGFIMTILAEPIQ